MPRAAAPNKQLLATVTTLGAAVWRLPPRFRAGVIALAVLAAVLYWAATHYTRPAAPVAPGADPATLLNPDGSGTFLFCFWNVENLFDDQDDRRREVDEPFDNAFAADAKLRQEKLDHLATTLLKMNGGKGPDVLACAEVESVRAADLLRGTLNRLLTERKADPGLQYTQVAMKNLDAGRHIAPCVITRLNVLHAYTKLHGQQLRILETRLAVNGHELCLVTSHWTSQLQQKSGGNGDSGRDKYAEGVRKVFAELYARRGPATDFLACGDFNSTPDSAPVVNVLGATGDRSKLSVLGKDGGPALLDLFADKSAAQYGTILYNGKPLIYDQICVSPGMLDAAGWGADPASVNTVTGGLMRLGTRREPWRFGDPARPPVGGRGFSDHFPVTVTLTVRPAAGRAVPAAPAAAP